MHEFFDSILMSTNMNSIFIFLIACHSFSFSQFGAIFSCMHVRVFGQKQCLFNRFKQRSVRRNSIFFFEFGGVLRLTKDNICGPFGQFRTNICRLRKDCQLQSEWGYRPRSQDTSHCCQFDRVKAQIKVENSKILATS